MNNKLILKVIGFILIIEAMLLVLPMIIAFIYDEGDWKYFLITALGVTVLGLIFYGLKTKKKNMHAIDGYFVVGLAWVVLSIVGAVPLCVSGSIPNFLDAIFEAVSGFTTTGVTVLKDVERLSHSMQFWRIMTQWIGGMGMLVFMLAISPVAMGGSAIHMLRAEAPGPTTEKISPKISTTAKYLYLVYIILTAAQFICLIFAGLSPYHSLLTAFSTMATGGFSYMNTSLATLTMGQRDIVIIFMILAGINFNLIFLMATGKFKKALKNEELRTYLITLVVVCVAIAVPVWISASAGSISEIVHHSIFASASVLTTTGFVSCDMNAWPWFAKYLIMLLMFVGACSGSTSCGMKINRIGIMLKSIKDSLHGIVHPRSVSKVRYNGKEVQVEVIRGIRFYVCLLIVIFAFSIMIVCIDPKIDFVTAFSAVDATINSNGIGFEGAAGTYADFAWYSKIVFMIDMLIGRLEILPVVILFSKLLTPIRFFELKVIKRIKSRYRNRESM